MRSEAAPVHGRGERTRLDEVDLNPHPFRNRKGGGTQLPSNAGKMPALPKKEKAGRARALPAFRWWWFVFSLWWKSMATANDEDEVSRKMFQVSCLTSGEVCIRRKCWTYAGRRDGAATESPPCPLTASSSIATWLRWRSWSQPRTWTRNECGGRV